MLARRRSGVQADVLLGARGGLCPAGPSRGREGRTFHHDAGSYNGPVHLQHAAAAARATGAGLLRGSRAGARNTSHSSDPTIKRKAVNIRTIRTPLTRVLARPALALRRFEGCDWPVPTYVCAWLATRPVFRTGCYLMSRPCYTIGLTSTLPVRRLRPSADIHSGWDEGSHPPSLRCWERKEPARFQSLCRRSPPRSQPSRRKSRS